MSKQPSLRPTCTDCGKLLHIDKKGFYVGTEQTDDLCTCNVLVVKKGRIAVPKIKLVTSKKESIEGTASTPAQIDLGDGYDLLGLLDQDGLGLLYKVLDKALGKTFVVKVLPSDLASDKRSIKKFQQVADAISQLDHYNLVAIYGHGFATNGFPYLVMDYLDGASLAMTLKKEGTFKVPRALDVFTQICEGLAYLHTTGMVHGNLTARHTMLVETDSASDLVKMIGFGLEADLSRTASDKTRYMSPEQCRGETLDARSDIYSLGCIMYEALPGKSLFASNLINKSLLKQAQPSPVGFDKVLNVPAKLEKVVVRCLNEEPSKRVQSANDLRKALEIIRNDR